MQAAPALIDGVLRGDRILLSRAITLVESRAERHQALARTVVEACLPHGGRSIRIGVTGSPGVGKSTFIEGLGLHLISQDKRPAVLAIDPSSKLSKGSILGDKTRMERLSQAEAAFIRPSPAGDSPGGVARKTREAITLCEAAGFDVIIVETVGVGQAETAVHSMVDFFLLLLLPGAGDELQGIKRGIVEMADLLVINKADGERQAMAKQAQSEYRNALQLYPPKESGWTPAVLTCSALTGAGIAEVWAQVEAYRRHAGESGFFHANREGQALYWLNESISDRLQRLFSTHPAVTARRKAIERAVLEGRMSPFLAADQLIELFSGGKGEGGSSEESWK